jgi:Xaa-Pro aminopeptidase
LKSLRLGRALEAGFVLTVEPGLYFIPQLIEEWEQKKILREYINYDKVRDYKAFGGLRVEDDLVITEAGSRMLGIPLPVSASEIELIRR